MTDNNDNNNKLAPAVITFPDVEYCEAHSGYYDRVLTIKTNFYPYYSNDWMAKAKFYNITIPEKFSKLIDRSMGVSECKECGHKVAGYQETCTNYVHKYRTEGYSWNRIYLQPKEKAYFKGDTVKFNESTQKIAYTEFSECASSMKWSLSHEFNEQRDFYNFLSSLIIDQHSNFAKFGHLIPDPKEAELAVLRYEISFLQANNSNILSALNMIKDKMNQAGNALYFNF